MGAVGRNRYRTGASGTTLTHLRRDVAPTRVPRSKAQSTSHDGWARAGTPARDAGWQTAPICSSRSRSLSHPAADVCEPKQARQQRETLCRSAAAFRELLSAKEDPLGFRRCPSFGRSSALAEAWSASQARAGRVRTSTRDALDRVLIGGLQMTHRVAYTPSAEPPVVRRARDTRAPWARCRFCCNGARARRDGRRSSSRRVLRATAPMRSCNCLRRSSRTEL